MEIIKQGNNVAERLYQGTCGYCKAVIRLKEKECKARARNVVGEVKYVIADYPCCTYEFYAFPLKTEETCDTIPTV